MRRRAPVPRVGYLDAIGPLSNSRDTVARRTGQHPFSRAVLRRVPHVLLPMSVFLALGVGGVSMREREKDLSLARRAAEGVVRLQARTIEREIELITSFLPYLVEQPAIRTLLSGESGPSIGRDYVQLLGAVGIFGRVRVLDPTGRELFDVRVRDGGPALVPLDALQREEDRSYFDRVWALPVGHVYGSSFLLAKEKFRLVEPVRPILRLATPIADASGEKRGVFEVEYLAQELLDRVRRAGEQVPGWAALVNERGYFLESPRGEGSWGFVFGLPPTFAAQHAPAWLRIRASEEGSLLLEDGLYVHLRVPVPRRAPLARSDLDLRAVVFSPADELYASSSRTLRILLIGGGVVWLALAALAWRLAYVGTIREAHERQLAASRRGLRQLSARLMDAQEEERRSVSRDLHDELGQQATALIIDLKRAQRAPDPEARGTLIGGAIRAGEALLVSLHRIASSLRAGILDDLGLAAAIEAMCTDFEQRSHIVTTTDLSFEDEHVPAPVARNVYRFVQEALTNALKHSKAKEIKVRAHEQDGAFEIELVDDGVGFDSAATGGDRLGLLGMRERVEQLRGVFTCTSAPGEGTRVAARIPLGEPGVGPGEGAR